MMNEIAFLRQGHLSRLKRMLCNVLMVRVYAAVEKTLSNTLARGGC